MLAIGFLAAGYDASATAQTPEQFYKGRQISLVVGLNPGGGFDAYARLITQYMPKYIPGQPSIVIRYMPGAGTIVAANYLYVRAPRDGSEIGLISSDISIAPLVGNEAAKFDSRKFTWLGSADSDSIYCISWKGTPFTSFKDILTREMIVGAAGRQMVNADNILMDVVKAKLRIVKGYDGTAALKLAAERGEIQGWCGVGLLGVDGADSELVRSGTARIIGQVGYDKKTYLPNVPDIAAYVQSDDDRRLLDFIFSYVYMSRPFAAPPDLPKDRVAVLRTAFEETLSDPELVARAAKSNVSIRLVKGEDIDAFIEDAYTTPKSVVERATRIINQKDN
jgi:tripartite-type tricarboxylate transporter receptor subunit TctC